MATLRQKKTLDIIAENHGAISVGEAMIKAGYDEDTAKRPKNLTDSKGWQELMDKYFPDEELAKVHREGLRATTKKPHLIDRDDKGRPVYDYVEEDDYSTRHKYLDSAYKLKGRFQEDQQRQPTTVNYNIFNKPEMKITVAEFEQRVKEQLMQGNVQTTQESVEA